MYATGEAPPLSAFTRHGDLIFISGHGAIDSNGHYLAPDFEGQMRHTMQLLQRTLRDAGTDFSHVLSVRSYIQDPTNLPLYNRIYREYFSAPFPARTTITNCLPPGLEFEIECVAAAPGEK